MAPSVAPASGERSELPTEVDTPAVGGAGSACGAPYPQPNPAAVEGATAAPDATDMAVETGPAPAEGGTETAGGPPPPQSDQTVVEGVAAASEAVPMAVEPQSEGPRPPPHEAGDGEATADAAASGAPAPPAVCYAGSQVGPAAPIILSPAAGSAPADPAAGPEEWPSLELARPGVKKTRAPKKKGHCPAEAVGAAAATPAAFESACPAATAPEARGAAGSAPSATGPTEARINDAGTGEVTCTYTGSVPRAGLIDGPSPAGLPVVAALGSRALSMSQHKGPSCPCTPWPPRLQSLLARQSAPAPLRLRGRCRGRCPRLTTLTGLLRRPCLRHRPAARRARPRRTMAAQAAAPLPAPQATRRPLRRGYMRGRALVTPK